MTGKTGRVAGVDVARALASLLMIQGHAYDGWVAEPHRGTLAYRFTRWLGTVPLPSFLVLAGAALGLSVLGAARAGVAAAPLRRRLVRRGLEIVAIGYAVSLAYGLLDGARDLDTFLRADVLHVIGLSIALVAFFGVREAEGNDAVAPRRLLAVAMAIGLSTTLPSFALQPLGANAPGSLRYVVALFFDVPGITRMPVFPLTGWFCIGVGAAFLFERSRTQAGGAFAAIAGASPRFLGGLFVASVAIAAAAAWATGWAADRSEAPLTRAHPAIVFNVVDLGARGLLLLSVGAALSVALPARVRGWATTLGQGSLVAYVFHVPFCYGRFGAGLARGLDMAEATAALLLLFALSVGAVVAADGRTQTPRARSRS